MKVTFSFRSTRAALVLSGTFVLGAAASCGPRNSGRPDPVAQVPAPAAPVADAAPAPVPSPQAPTPPAAPAPATPLVAGFEKLTGRWLRPDGGYILEVRSISPEGKVDAAYLNPRPIHVARAEALRQGEALTLFVELRDANYPGSTYKLIYDPARDVLAGLYFQALQQQTFDVEFVRR